MKPSDFGMRRTPVTIQALTETADPLGQLLKIWTDVCIVWCLKRALSGRELLNASQTKSVAEFVLETWYPQSLVTLTAQHRLLIGGVVHGISWTNNVDDLNETILIYCTAPLVPVEAP